MKTLITIVLISALFLSFQDDTDYWEILSKIKYKQNRNPTWENPYSKPIFPKEVKALNGKNVVLVGFVWMYSEKHKPGKILSKFSTPPTCISSPPLGPECFVKLETTSGFLYSLDKPIKVEGKLFIDENAEDNIYFKVEVESVEMYQRPE